MNDAPMPGIIFLDCNPTLLALWNRVHRPEDPNIDLNMGPVIPDDVPRLVQGFHTCINDATFLSKTVLERCAGLHHIVFLGTGASSYIDLQAADSLGIQVSTIKGYGDTAVAEHTMALALAAARRIVGMDRDIRQGRWQQLEGLQLRGKIFGIIGYGAVGQQVARIAKSLGLEVIAWNRSVVSGPDARMLPLEQVLERSHILSLHLALTEQTRGFLDETKLQQTRPGVIIVNTARAALINHPALVHLIRTGHIRHAALDVFEAEPPHPDDPVLRLEDVTLTAHSAFLTQEATMTLLRRAIDLAGRG